MRSDSVEGKTGERREERKRAISSVLQGKGGGKMKKFQQSKGLRTPIEFGLRARIAVVYWASLRAMSAVSSASASPAARTSDRLRVHQTVAENEHEDDGIKLTSTAPHNIRVRRRAPITRLRWSA